MISIFVLLNFDWIDSQVEWFVGEENVRKIEGDDRQLRVEKQKAAEVKAGKVVYFALKTMNLRQSRN